MRLPAACLACLIAVPAVAHATTKCGDRDTMIKVLANEFDETPQALGLSTDGGLLELLVSPEGGFTILVTYPNRRTCVVAVGSDWTTTVIPAGDPI